MAWLDAELPTGCDSGPDHSVIASKMRGGIVILEAAQHRQNGNHSLNLRAICKEGGKALQISAVFVFVFVGLLEPSATLALWLGWMQCFLQDMNSGPYHSAISSKMRAGIAILEAVWHR